MSGEEIDTGRRNFLKGSVASGTAMAAGIEVTAMILAFAYDSYTTGAEAAEKSSAFLASVKAVIEDDRNELKKLLNQARSENVAKSKKIEGQWNDVDATGKKVTITSMSFAIEPDEEFGAITTITFKGKREGSDKVELLGSATMKAKKVPKK